MDAELTSIVTSAATEAESRLGEFFKGPDGGAYIGIFHAPDAFALVAAGLEMTANGFPDRTVLSLTCTRAQFDAPPLSWKRNKTPLVRPTTGQSLYIYQMTDDDPLHYGFVLTNHQPGAR